MKQLVLGVVLLLSLVIFDTKAADPIDTITTGELHFALAVGYGGIENPRAKSEEIITYALPSWSYYDERFYVENFTLGYSLYESDTFLIDLQSQLNEDGLFFEFDGLNKIFMSDILGFVPQGAPIKGKPTPLVPVERNISYLGGIKTTWVSPYVDLSLSYFHDISGVHQGNEIHFNLNKNIGFSWGALGFEIGAVRKSENLVNYYYHYTAAELGRKITAGLQPSESSINYHARSVLNLPLGHNFNFVTLVTYTWLGNGITRNAMVEKDSYLSGFIGVSYAF
ncbi:MipA/OmpV family protein [Shewanella sp. Isolate11]|uniref:MipA/OmpV family protein n=1 Tax=Shewanella sp. Isolate11 TaxID=2908530 RepID=UPI001EFEDA45|nr:MipA/OmpV family protein [Shewanella sp. Isolate11]MCG9697647.1 MipA/OmpV family protein [Shewanella sp. Isolate11]